MSEDIIGGHSRGWRWEGGLLASSEQRPARDAAKHPAMHRTVPHKKCALAQSVSTAETEKT